MSDTGPPLVHRVRTRNANSQDRRDDAPHREKREQQWSPRLIGLVAATILVSVVPSAILLINPDITDPLGRLSYAGVFLINLISTATVFVPVPGITAAGNVLIATEGSDAQWPWLVGIAGGVGMAMGEITAYLVGVFGSHATRQYEPPRLIAPFVRKLSAFVTHVMRRWGTLTLFLLAAIPDPVFELAALSAGSVRMPLVRFFGAVLSGCIVRGLTLAYLGSRRSCAASATFGSRRPAAPTTRS